MTKTRSEQIKDTLNGKTVTSESWTTPTLQNNWLQYGGSFESCQYMKDANGFVRIKGLIKSGTTGDGVIVFTLPTGYGPSGVLIFPSLYFDGVLTQTRIGADGDVRIYTSSAGWYSFGRIIFKAEQ